MEERPVQYGVTEEDRWDGAPSSRIRELHEQVDHFMIQQEAGEAVHEPTGRRENCITLAASESSNNCLPVLDKKLPLPFCRLFCNHTLPDDEVLKTILLLGYLSTS